MKKSLKRNLNVKNHIQEGLIDKIELPSSIVLNLPLITIIGRSKINIENFKSILEYSTIKIRISTSCGILKIEGTELYLKEFSKEKISIKGNILKFEFVL